MVLILIFSQTGLQIITTLFNHSQNQWEFSSPTGSLWQKNIALKTLRYHSDTYDLTAENINIQTSSLLSSAIHSLEVKQVSINIKKWPEPQLQSSWGGDINKTFINALKVTYNHEELIKIKNLNTIKDQGKQYLSYDSDSGPLKVAILGPNVSPTDTHEHHTILLSPDKISLWQKGDSHPFLVYDRVNHSWKGHLNLKSLSLPGMTNTALQTLTFNAEGNHDKGQVKINLQLMHFNKPVIISTELHMINQTTSINIFGNINNYQLKSNGLITPTIDVNTQIDNPETDTHIALKTIGSRQKLTVSGSIDHMSIPTTPLQLDQLSINADVDIANRKLDLSAHGIALLPQTEKPININKIKLESSNNHHSLTSEITFENNTLNFESIIDKQGQQWIGSIQNMSLFLNNQDQAWNLLNGGKFTIKMNQPPVFKELCLKQDNLNHFCIKGGLSPDTPWELRASIQQNLKNIPIPLSDLGSTYISPISTHIRGIFQLQGDINGINSFKGDVTTQDIQANLYNLVPNLFMPLNLHLKSGHINIESSHKQLKLSGNFQAKEGDIEISGSKNLETKTLSIVLHSKNILLKDNNKNEIIISPDIELNYQDNKLNLIKGKIHVIEGAINLQRFNQVLEISPDVTILGDKQSKQITKKDLSISFSPLVHIQYLGFNGNVSGHLNIKDEHDTNITGSLVSTNATFQAFQRKTAIKQASINFYGESWLQGHLLVNLEKTSPHSQNLNSQHQLIRSSLQLYGPLDNLKLQLESSPVHLSDYEIISLIFSTPAAKTPLTDAQIINTLSAGKHSNIKPLIALIETLHSLESRFFIDQVFLSNPSLAQGDVTDPTTYITLSKQLGKLTIQYQFNLVDENQKRMNFSFQLSPKTYIQTYFDQDKSGIALFYKFSTN